MSSNIIVGMKWEAITMKLDSSNIMDTLDNIDNIADLDRLLLTVLTPDEAYICKVMFSYHAGVANEADAINLTLKKL